MPEIEYRNIATLKTHPRNYRHGDLGAIINSVLTFGFNGALRVWRDNVVLAGNHSLLALQSIKAQGLAAPRGIHVEGKQWLVACVDVSHLTEVQADAFLVADNRTAELASNDDQQLAELLSAIASEDEKLLRATGFDPDDLDQLLQDIANDALPQDWKAYDESVENEVQYCTCPECGHKFPK